MKRFLIIISSAAIIWCATAASAPAAYLYLEECRKSLNGYPSPGQDDEQYWAWENSRNWGAPVGWGWGDYYRYSSNRIIQFVNIRLYTGQVLKYRGWCYDDNHTGQIASSEDWLG